MTCSGMLGKRCTCGKDHDLPITMEEDRPSMFANGWFWASAVLSAVLWSAVAFLK